MIIAVGFTTGKIYMEGNSRAECLRKLNDKYPSVINHHYYTKHGAQVDKIYPEKLILLRR